MQQVTWIHAAFVLCTLVHLSLTQTEPPRVNIPGLGSIEGHSDWVSTWSERPIYAYRGIPFGKSPSGPLRYKPSIPAEPWKGTIEGKRFGHACLQSGVPAGKKDFWQYLHSFEQYVPDDLKPLPRAEGEDVEDCLYLQVYTPLSPDQAANGNLPVMVFFHGGAFLGGSSLIYWPHNLLEYDVILVVPHYRLGPLGYISMQNSEVPGNGGMFDQILALEWVAKYIHVFGGNPADVTAFGESAGAASVSLLSLNDRVRGKFNRIIAESGSAITEWAIDRYPVYNALGIAKYCGCDVEAPEEEINACLMAVDAQNLTDAYEYHWKLDEMKNGKTGFGGCSPVVQLNKDAEIFIDKMPIEYWQNESFTTVPAMYGANKHEGTYVMALVYDEYLRANDYLDEPEFIKYQAISVFLDLFEINDPAYLVHDALEYEYVGVDRLGNITAMTPGMIDFSGATFLKASSFQNMVLHSKLPGNTYWYAFNFFDRASMWPFVGGYFDVPFPGGVTHANELMFVFRIPGLWPLLTDKEQQKAFEMGKIWYNYGRYGETQPSEHFVENVPEWPVYDVETDSYVRFDDVNQLLTYFPTEYTIAKDEDFSLVPWP